MAISINLKKTPGILFCASKWWGDPDMPENMEYPMVQVEEDGEISEYPLTFICQINCEDIAEYDEAGEFPHEGMLYFFAAIDKYLGYDSPVQNGPGKWPKGHVVVKYAKNINFETFKSCILVDDEDNSLTEPPLKMEFGKCQNNDGEIILGEIPCHEDVAGSCPDHVNLLQIGKDVTAGTDFESGGVLNIIISRNDLKFGNFKKAKGFLSTGNVN